MAGQVIDVFAKRLVFQKWNCFYFKTKFGIFPPFFYYFSYSSLRHYDLRSFLESNKDSWKLVDDFYCLAGTYQIFFRVSELLSLLAQSGSILLGFCRFLSCFREKEEGLAWILYYPCRRQIFWMSLGREQLLGSSEHYLEFVRHFERYLESFEHYLESFEH